MIPPRFVIVDMDTPDGPLFWSNEDGWVGWGTESILEATATETETLRLPMGNRVEWVNKKAAEELMARPAKLTTAQRRLLTQLNNLLNEATNLGLLDAIQVHCKNPDSINDLCDAVTFVDRNYN